MNNLIKHLINKKRLNVNYWGVINKYSYSSKVTEYEIFENEKSLEKFQEFKVNKIIYQKDYKNYIKLYKLCNPEYSKLTIEKGNLFNFSIEWIFKRNNIVVRVENSECKKIKTFTHTLSLLQEKVNEYNIISKEESNKNKKKKIKNNNNNNNKIDIKSDDINNLKDIYNNDEKKLTTRVVEENGNKCKSKINYIKLNKIWDTYLFYKEKKQLEEKKVYFEILKKSFLKAEFFEKNKKKDFEFFENILTSLLLKPSIFINVLNSLHLIFFVPPVPLQVKEKNDTRKEAVNHLIDFQIRKYILNYLFNIYYEKYIGLKNLYKTFDLHKSYKLKFCRRENDTFKFVSLDNIDVEKRGILLIKYYKNNKDAYKKNDHDENEIDTYNNDIQKSDIHNNHIHIDNKEESSFLIGIVKNIRKIQTFCVLYMDIKKYKYNEHANMSSTLYEDIDINDEYYECFLNNINQSSISNINTIIKNSELNNEDDKNNILLFEAVPLTIQLTTISKRIKLSMLNIFDRKDFLNNDILHVLLNEKKYMETEKIDQENEENKENKENEENQENEENEENKLNKLNRLNKLNKQEFKLNNIFFKNSINYNYLIEEAINKFLENREREIQQLNIVDKDMIKKDQIIYKLYKSLKNDISQFNKMCNMYKKFDIYQKSVLYDIIINEKRVPIHLIHGAPGSGKSDLISFIIYMLTLEKKNNIFVGTNKHISVENIRNKLINLNLCLNRDNINKSVHQKSDIYIDTIYQAFKIKDKKIKHLFIDEASSLSEYNSLICLNLNCDFIYAFGDEKQLTFHSLINEKKRLDINYLSIFEKLKRYENIKNHFLLIQYRLIFPMYLFISFYFYNQKLIASKNIMDNYFKDNEKKKKKNDIFTPYETIPILFIDTYHQKFNKQTFEQKVNYSYINHFEAQIILKLIQILLCSTNKKNLAILTPYTSQKIYIQNMLENNYKHNTITLHQNVEQENNHLQYLKYQKVMNNSCNPFERNTLFSLRSNGHSTEIYDNNHNNNNKKNNMNINAYTSISNQNNNNEEEGYIFEHNKINTSIYDYNNNTIKRTNNLLFNTCNVKTQSTHNSENEEENNQSIYKNVHTIDSYQGCENDFIIISTVRSNDNNLLGFLNDEKRMNVLLTRMKKKIIIIGNSNTLKTNFFWKEFISFLDFFNSRKSVFTYPLQNIFR
ncbi:conserved Plasmodium protein, unknown function [Plasmodium sp. gorilla clade G2]|uniref:conserved Plasmodium protein, unknown function n=1 Tax=Plasmodium sp. gorilla clade G2 TaxID=880535 RepID=UPI000D22853E|nr:conserved Plasmodium protein, unknown function [Plasmodium sp. gorilla clade G2]SOV17946.1 conserved Plasmodium protein, unknown function [Plasmodium sp. gorilla clade G2]